MFPVTFPEQQLAMQMVKRHGVSNNDYFKLWPDKEYLFDEALDGVVAFGVSKKVAFAYGNPAASPAAIGPMIDQYVAHCRRHGWTPAFYQVTPHYLDIYRQKGFHIFRSSEDAIVDVRNFSLAGKANRRPRWLLNHFAKQGIRAVYHESPVPSEIVAQARLVSDSWLASGRRERKFGVGRFTPDYARNTPLLAAMADDGTMLAFINIIPSYAEGTVAIDMMRFSADAPRNTMDFLFVNLFQRSQARGHRFVSMASAPITQFDDAEQLLPEEKSYYWLTQHLDAYFSMAGLRRFKAKYATIWQPYYLIYPKRSDLLRLFPALTQLTELPENRKPLFGKDNRQLLKAVAQEAMQQLRQGRPKHPLQLERSASVTSHS